MSRLTRKTNGKDYCLYCDCIEMENAIFEKKQELLSPEKYYKEEPYKMEYGYYYKDAMKRLGKIEDLMDEYNINSIEELEILINSHKKQEKEIINLSAVFGMFQNGNINLIKDIEKYWNLEEELGCPLEVVFKAMTMGIIVRNHEDLIEMGYSDRKDKYVYFSTEEIYLKNWQSHGIEKTTNCFQITYGDDGEWCVYLKDYQKTWWLKGEKDDTCNGND